MSAEAGAYYLERAAAVGLDLAPALSGKLVMLLEGGPVSLHRPKQDALDAMAARASEVLGAAAVLVTAEARKLYEMTGPPAVPMSPSRLIKGPLMNNLRHRRYQAGHFTDIGMETLARREVDERILPSLAPAAQGRTMLALGAAADESRQVYLLTRAAFKASGKPTEYTRAFTLVKAEEGLLVPKYFTIALGHNALPGALEALDGPVTTRAQVGKGIRPEMGAV